MRQLLRCPQAGDLHQRNCLWQVCQAHICLATAMAPGMFTACCSPLGLPLPLVFHPVSLLQGCRALGQLEAARPHRVGARCRMSVVVNGAIQPIGLPPAGLSRQGGAAGSAPLQQGQRISRASHPVGAAGCQ